MAQEQVGTAVALTPSRHIACDSPTVGMCVWLQDGPVGAGAGSRNRDGGWGRWYSGAEVRGAVQTKKLPKRHRKW